LAKEYMETFLSNSKEFPSDRHIVIAPPFTAISSLASLLKGTKISLSSQNVHWEDKGAFTAEIYRSGIQSIHKGQTEAAQTVGLNSFQTMRYVILPQAIKRILPPLANQFIYIVKMSAFASVIGMQELMRRANEVVVSEYRPLEIYTLLIFEYLILVLIISQAVRWLERKMGSDESKG